MRYYLLILALVLIIIFVISWLALQNEITSEAPLKVSCPGANLGDYTKNCLKGAMALSALGFAVVVWCYFKHAKGEY